MDDDDLWMQLHRLASSFDDAGLTREERLRFAVRQLQKMPPTVRCELLSELKQLAEILLDLQPVATAAENQAEAARKPARKTG
jgi:hypothetical protein